MPTTERMDLMDSNMTRILQELTGAARDAADKAMAAASAAKDAVSEKYDAVKMALEYSRLEDQQEDVFSDIGRMMFLLHTGKVKDTVATDDGPRTPQQVIDALLLNAEQLAQQMDAIEEKLALEEEDEEDEDGQETFQAMAPCPHCGHLCAEGDHFCSACGGALPEDFGGESGAPAQPDAPDASQNGPEG